MQLNIIFDDVKKAVETCRLDVDKRHAHHSCCCVIAEAISRTLGQKVEQGGFSFFVLADGTTIDTRVTEKARRVIDFFDNHYITRTPEEIFNYFEAQGLLTVDYKVQQ